MPTCYHVSFDTICSCPRCPLHTCGCHRCPCEKTEGAWCQCAASCGALVPAYGGTSDCRSDTCRAAGHYEPAAQNTPRTHYDTSECPLFMHEDKSQMPCVQHIHKSGVMLHYCKGNVGQVFVGCKFSAQLPRCSKQIFRELSHSRKGHKIPLKISPNPCSCMVPRASIKVCKRGLAEPSA